MLAVARGFLRTEEDSADAVQDAFLSAFRSLDGFQGNAALATWLHRILVNVCLMKLRTGSRCQEVSIDDLLPSFDESGQHTCPIRPWKDQALAQLIQQETRAHVRACIDQLPSSHREVLLLRDMEGLDTEETAQLLGINPGAVKTRLHRARQRSGRYWNWCWTFDRTMFRKWSGTYPNLSSNIVLIVLSGDTPSASTGLSDRFSQQV